MQNASSLLEHMGKRHRLPDLRTPFPAIIEDHILANGMAERPYFRRTVLRSVKSAQVELVVVI